MSTSTGRDDFRDLPILGELRDQLQARFESAASPVKLSTRRRRWPRTGSRLGVVLAALAVAGGSALAAGLLSGQRSRPLSAVFAPGSPTTQEGYGPPGSTYSISISPSMQAGVIGWCTALVTYRGAESFDLGTGGCNGAPPAVGAPMFGARDGGIGSAGLSYVFTAPQVAAVRVTDGPTILTRPDPRLPFGFRAAVFSLPERLLRGAGVALTAVDSTGQAIPGDAYAAPVTEATRSWRAPNPPAKGACSIAPRGSSPVVLGSGTVLSAAIGDPGILGRAFLPCVTTSFTLHGTRFAAAVLLDAKEPGQLPAQLPDMQPLAGHPGIFARQRAMTNLFDDLANNLDITARRVKNTWLVVAGGANNAQRTAVLNALTVGPVNLKPSSPPTEPPRHALCWIAYHPANRVRALSQTGSTSPPPLLALLKRGSGWRTHGRWKEITSGHTTYLLLRSEQAFLAQPPCATATFLVGDWTLEATVQLTVGKGIPIQLKGTAPTDGHAALLRRDGAEGERAGIWQEVGGAWLQITGATALQQEALLKDLTVTTPAG
ncbi:MAG TPA: hypothetical protein VKG38_05185 [Solirubrobacteraceae bacterium]|nr:hypothetical protein [Solirubrobacteraceae bacterium]